MSNSYSLRHLLLALTAAALLSITGCAGSQLGSAKLLGTWKAESVEMEGTLAEGKIARTIEVIFAEKDHNTITFLTDGQAHKGTVQVDTSTDPKRITIRPAEGNLTDKAMFGIFAVDGESLTLCLSHRRPPPSFATRAGYDYVLIKLKRQDPTPQDAQ